MKTIRTHSRAARYALSAVAAATLALTASSSWALGLGRLAVQPAVRGRGAGTRLIRELCAEGSRALAVPEFSLFVLIRNWRAERLYRALGFVDAVYPEALPSSEPRGSGS